MAHALFCCTKCNGFHLQIKKICNTVCFFFNCGRNLVVIIRFIECKQSYVLFCYTLAFSIYSTTHRSMPGNFSHFFWGFPLIIIGIHSPSDSEQSFFFPTVQCSGNIWHTINNQVCSVTSCPVLGKTFPLDEMP